MMLLQIYFEVAPEKESDFQSMYTRTYVPALRQQRGYLASKLLRLFPPEIAGEIQAAGTEFNYQMELIFDTEENRRRWVDSKEHSAAWPEAESLSQSVAWRGYDIAGDDAIE